MANTKKTASPRTSDRKPEVGECYLYKFENYYAVAKVTSVSDTISVLYYTVGDKVKRLDAVLTRLCGCIAIRECVFDRKVAGNTDSARRSWIRGKIINPHLMEDEKGAV